MVVECKHLLGDVATPLLAIEAAQDAAEFICTFILFDVPALLDFYYRP